MYLKKVEIQGFKSFADKTEIEFKGGITAVVGPNGSGKSNVSDALRWVLGEQSAKTLRGSKMEDIIFSGTNSRKPTGYAEVTLVLDNKDEKLPIDYSEVSITRRMFRSGESEYYINKNSCRLKDIRELFMDTGVGKDGYSIIGQGRIDEILSTKSEDRRMIFEEAAGIVKYKTRKEEAEKKLEKTNENLIRIKDIIGELENQIEPLKIQAEKAKEFLSLSKRLKELEVNLFLRDIDRLQEEITHIEAQKELVEKQLKYNEDKREILENKYNKVKNEIERMDSKIDELQNLKYSIQSNMEKKDGELNLAKEKKNFLEKEMDRQLHELKNIEIQIEQTSNKELEEFNYKLELQKKENKLNDEIESLNKDLEELDSNIKKREQIIDEEKSNLVQYLNLIADKKSKINSISTFNKSIDKRIEKIEKEISEINIEIEENKNIAEAIQKNIKKYNEGLECFSTNKAENLKIINEVLVKIDNLKTSIDGIIGDIHGKTSKLKLLTEMKDEYDGYYKSVKNALIACKNDKKLGKGVRGVVAELLTVDKIYEKAIEIALGSALQNIVTDTPEDAKKIIEFLKRNKMGRVTFLPISSIKPRKISWVEEKFSKTKGYIGIASNLINYDDEYKNIFEYLLGRVLIVNTLDDGIKIAKQSNYAFKIVSLDGDVINSGGSITGGSVKSAETNLIGRERQINELKKEIIELRKNYSHYNNQIQKYKTEQNEIEAFLKDIDDKVNKYNVELAKMENRYNQCMEEIEKNKILIGKYEKEKEQLLDESFSSDVNIKDIKNELEELNVKVNKTQGKIDEFNTILSAQKIDKEKINKLNTDLQIKVATIRQELVSIENSIDRNNSLCKRLKEELQIKEKEKDRNQQEISDCKQKINCLLEEKQRLSEELLECDIKLNELKNERNNFMQAYYSDQEKLNQMNKKINDLQKSVSSLQIKREKFSMQLENINYKLQEEYELTLEQAKKYRKKIENVGRSQSEIRNIKSKIKALGNINIDSIDEFKRVNERYDFMKKQREDLIEAKESLNDVIKDMNKKMKQQFKENFDLIRNNFSKVFVKLFGGGKADVYIEDEENILTSGIEIVAQPPGKRLQNLSLLSGGERALTAIALLFAILETKPTPFCILDEIEAALDDANVYRYADYLKEFSNETQFIVITHRKGTMECADSLYGITMEEEGISKLISVKLTESNDKKAS